MRLHPSLSIAALLLSSFSKASNDAEQETNQIEDPPVKTSQNLKEESSQDFQCRLYLALSSIPNAGFGIFTAQAISEGESVHPYADSMYHSICDIVENGATYQEYGDTPQNLDDYMWDGMTWSRHECDEAYESAVNLGSLVNFHTYFINVVNEVTPYDDTILNRYKDPAAGAVTYHGGHSFQATRDIMAGEELFADYGGEWLDSREGTFADFVPRKKEFEDSAKILRSVHRQLSRNKINLTNDALRAVAGIISDIGDLEEGDGKNGNIGRIASLLPHDVEDFLKILRDQKEDSTQPGPLLASETRIANNIAETTIQKRSVEWIKENGICLDRIRPGKSTIPGIGHGAFAQETIAVGSIVSPVPLINILDRSFLNVYNRITGKNGKQTAGEEHISEQLILNYCFGNIDSRVVFCPLTNSGLVNHCSKRTQQCGPLGPNAEIRWGQEWDPNTSEWLNLTLEELWDRTSRGKRGLSLEIVATREIKPGEEVFIDYGENWEAAWETHVEKWEAPVDDGSFIPIRTLINNKDFRSNSELESNPYPKNAQLVCFFGDYVMEELIEENADLPESLVLPGEDFVSDYADVDGDSQLEPCEIIEKCSEGSCTVRIFTSHNEKDYTILLPNYPAKSMTFRMKPYTSDMHLPNAFRHFIEINDSIFPEKWKIPSDILAKAEEEGDYWYYEPEHDEL